MTTKERTLLPVRNARGVIPHVCGTCKYGRIENGGFFCLRPDGPTFDAGDLWHWLYTCDLYVSDDTVPARAKKG